MAHYKRGKCRYSGKHKNRSDRGKPSMRARLGLEPVALPASWWTSLLQHERDAIDFGDYSRGRKYNAGYPRWHDILYHSRPRRREERRYEYKAMHGSADLDDLAWPLSKKPHNYYW
jgi:hypothetical protein